jgi:hypothetical protein
MSEQIFDMTTGIIWRQRIGRHGVYDVATNSEDIRFKALVRTLRNRGNKAYADGWSLWLLADGSPARRRLKGIE